jgi:hypothetical protein
MNDIGYEASNRKMIMDEAERILKEKVVAYD